MFLLRLVLPDRPGSLGAVATAMGTAGADIAAVEIIQKSDGFAVDDFVVDLPNGTLPDKLVSACTALDGVDVLWMGYFPEQWGLQADLDVLDEMTENPARAEQILADAAPKVFRVHWAMVVDRESGRVLHATELAPDLASGGPGTLGGLDVVRTAELPDGWLDGWLETIIAVAPFKTGRSIVLGRRGGPEFIPSELARLRHLAALAH